MIPKYIPKKSWWKCDCHHKLQKQFYPTIIGQYKLCIDGDARLTWGDKLEDIIKNKKEKLKLPNKELNETITRLKKFNKWRRSENINTFNDLDISPKQIGIDIDFIVKWAEDKSR